MNLTLKNTPPGAQVNMLLNTFRLIALGLIVVLQWSTPGQAEDVAAVAQRMLADVKTLASDEFEGRGIGTAGLDKAANYIADAFQAAGLQVDVAGGDPFQEFEVLDGAKLTTPNRLALVAPDGTPTELVLDTDFEVCSFGDSGAFSGPVVFAGYGIESDEPQYNDFEGVDLNGAVVVILRRNPQQSNPHGPFAVGQGVSRHAALTTKVSHAFGKGAAAVLLVNDPFSGRDELESLKEQLQQAQDAVLKTAETMAAGEADAKLLEELKGQVNHLRQVREQVEAHNSDTLMNFGYAGTRSGKSIPVFHITQAACNKMLTAALGKSLEQLEQQIDETGQPASAVLEGWKADGEASLEVVRKPTSNVIGILEGTGPLKDETIVIGAHFDHLGYGGEGSLTPGSMDIHNGADDNASGTAGLLEIARRLGAREQPLPRRIVFIAFSGEERGLLGAEQYVDNPLFPLDSTVAMFNMDMIGRLEESNLTVFGTGTSSRWEKLLDDSATVPELKLSRKPEGFGPSDHSSFYGKKIPVLHLFTGTHSDYHRPGDDWEKINAQGMARIIDFLEPIVVSTAVNDTRPDYIEIAARADLQRQGRRAYFGSIPDFSNEAAGYAIQGVAPGSPAEKGGIKGGDIIIKLGETKIGGLDDFDLALRKFSPGEQVDVTVLRDGQEVALKITLAAPRG